jgi:hypothetical protein
MSVQDTTPDSLSTSGGEVPAEAPHLVVTRMIEQAQQDERAHACCHQCYPLLGSASPYVSLCGLLAVPDKAEGSEFEAPPNACEDCLKQFGHGCRFCGAEQGL